MRTVSQISLYPQTVRPVRALAETARRRRWLSSHTYAAGEEREVSLRKDRDSFAAELERRMKAG